MNSDGVFESHKVQLSDSMSHTLTSTNPKEVSVLVHGGAESTMKKVEKYSKHSSDDFQENEFNKEVNSKEY